MPYRRPLITSAAPPRVLPDVHFPQAVPALTHSSKLAHLLVSTHLPAPHQLVQVPMQMVRKFTVRSLTAACDLALQRCCLFLVIDRISDLRFLIDTGAEISVLPSCKCDRTSKSPGPMLRAANSTSITTYGLRSLTLYLGMRRTFQCVFIVAGVNQPILSSDFLTQFDLDVSMRRIT